MESINILNTTKPFKISVYNPTNDDIMQTYVLLGDRPKEVYNACRAIIYKNGKLIMNNGQLKKIINEFGNNWKNIILPINVPKKQNETVSNVITGGYDNNNDNTSIQPEFGDDFNLEDVYLSTDKDRKSTKGPSSNDTSDILGQILSDVVESSDDVKITMDDLRKVKKSRDQEVLEYKSNIMKYEGNRLSIGTSYIYPEDSMNDIKEKIYLETNIPPFRQHLFWFIDGVYTTTYNLFTDKLYDVDVRDLFSDGNIKEKNTLDIKEKKSSNDKKSYNNQTSSEIHQFIDKYLYNQHESIKIIPRETFILAREIPNQIYVVDITLLINKLLIRESLGDNYKFNYIYFGFVVKYFPMMTSEVFRTYIVNEEEISRRYLNIYPNKNMVSRKFANEKIIYDNMTKQNNNLKTIIGKMFIEINGKSTVNLRNLFDIIKVNDAETTDKQHPFIIPEIHAYLTHNNKHYFIRKQYKYISDNISNKFPYDMRDGVVIALKCYLDNKIDDKSVKIYRFMYIQFLVNGNYRIKMQFDETDNISFENIVKFLQKYTDGLINYINNHSKYIFTIETTYDLISTYNINFQSLDLGVYWKKTLTDNNFRNFKDILSIYVSAGIITEKTYKQSGVFDFKIKKGIDHYNEYLIERDIKLNTDILNYYIYLLSPEIGEYWNSMFGGKICKIIHRTTDVKFELINVVEHEYNSILKYINELIGRTENIKEIPGNVTVNQNIKKLKKLREYDPILYNLKKYGTNANYSILCQNPTQPLIYTDDEVKRMSKENAKKLIKYWNFTLNKPAYYKCPNPKYKHLNFIVGVHPLNYCLPCCKKVESKEKSKKTKVMNQCLETHRWDANKKNLDTNMMSKYITVYGKDLPPDRYSRLSLGLSKLFDNTLLDKNSSSNKNTSLNNNSSQINYSRLNYYIVGIKRGNILDKYDVKSFILSLLYVMKIDINKFITLINTYITDITFSQLLNGVLPSFVKNVSMLKQIITELLIMVVNVEIKYKIKYISAEHVIGLIIEILSIYYNINIIIFNDINQNGMNVSMNVPLYMKNNFTNENSKFILLNQFSKYFNPICIFENNNINPITSIYSIMKKDVNKIEETKKNINEYNNIKRNHTTNQGKLSSSIQPSDIQTQNKSKKILDNSLLITTLSKVIISFDTDENRYKSNQLIDMAIIKRFTQSCGDTIICKYISNYNLIYGVEIMTKNKLKYYLPVNLSQNLFDDIETNTTTIPNIGPSFKFSTLENKIKALNEFILLEMKEDKKRNMKLITHKDNKDNKYNKEIKNDKNDTSSEVISTQTSGSVKTLLNTDIPKYKLIEINNFIIEQSKLSYQFMHENQIFKFGLIDGNYKHIFDKSEKIKQRYSLDEINGLLLNYKNNMKNNLGNDRDNDNQSNNFNNSNIIFKKIGKAHYDNLKYQLLTSEFTKYLNKEKNNSLRNKIISIIENNKYNLTIKDNMIKELIEPYSSDDYVMIMTFINNYLKNNKYKLIELIRRYPFAFDQSTLSRLHNMPKEKIIKELQSIVKNFTIIKKLDNNIDFPNVYLPCSVSNSSYCSGGKLVIESNETLATMLDLLASDIINPIKFDAFMKHISTDNIIDYFKFNINSDELLFVNVIEYG